uniref:Cystatin domain-containing protein n=1 Tax=Aegilops tauschii subsp. strangulata TaxID=200361 RepID=A0A453SJV0_AEGTS
MRTCSLLIIIAAVVAVAYPVATSAQVAWYPIGGINEPHVQELGRWAVAEHVKQAHDGLKFIKEPHVQELGR